MILYKLGYIIDQYGEKLDSKNLRYKSAMYNILKHFRSWCYLTDGYTADQANRQADTDYYLHTKYIFYFVGCLTIQNIWLGSTKFIKYVFFLCKMFFIFPTVFDK
jgi:hypothetical protein